MKTNQIKLGAFLSYIQMGISIIISFAYAPVMIRLLGQSEYGLYNTVSSTISMLSILNLGFNSAYIRYFAKYRKNNDTDSVERLNGLFLIIFSIIGIIAFVCGMYLAFHLKIVFKTGLTESEYHLAKILMLLLTCNLAISFPMSVFANIILANERFVFFKLVGIVNTILGPLVTMPLLLMGFGSIAIVTVSIVLTFSVDVIYIIYVIVILKNRFVFHGFERGIFKSLFGYTFFIAINIIIDQINWNIDKMLLARYCGTVHVAVYSVGYTIYASYQLFSTSISGMFTPRIHQLINESEDVALRKKNLTELFVKVGRIQFLVLALIVSGFIFFGRAFINFWVGEGYYNSYFVALLLMLPASVALIQNLGIEIQRAENKHQFRSIAYFFMALINLILSIFLCQKYGEIGSAIGTALSLIIANGIIMNVYYHKACDIDIWVFWKNIVSQSRGLLIPIVGGSLMMCFVDYKGILKLLVMIIVYVIIYSISMWKFGMNDYEKSLFGRPIRKMMRKNHDKNK